MSQSGQQHSHLFTLRIWTGEAGDPAGAWRGQIDHVLSGKRQFFRDWDALIAFLQSAVDNQEAKDQQEAEP